MRKRAADILVLTLIVLASGLTMMGVISGTVDQEIKMGKFNREYNELKIVNINNLQAGYAMLKTIDEAGDADTFNEFHCSGQDFMPGTVYESLNLQAWNTYEEIKEATTAATVYNDFMLPFESDPNQWYHIPSEKIIESGVASESLDIAIVHDDYTVEFWYYCSEGIDTDNATVLHLYPYSIIYDTQKSTPAVLDAVFVDTKIVMKDGWELGGGGANYDSNHPPVWNNDTLSATENTTFSVDLTDYCSDEDGDSLTFTLKSGNGTLNGSVYSWTIPNNFVPEGQDSIATTFSVQANDGKETAEKTYTLDVQANNHPPDWSDHIFNVTPPDTFSVDLTEYCSDEDGDPLTFILISGNGTLNGGVYSWTVPDGFVHEDAESAETTFSVQANDGKKTADKTYTLIVFSNGGGSSYENHLPIWVDQSFESFESDTFSVDLTNYCTDQDEDSLSFELLSGEGTLDGAVYCWTIPDSFVPDGEESTIAQFEVQAGDGKETVDKTYQITVFVKNKLPVWEAPSDFEIEAGAYFELDLSAYVSDEDNDELTFELTSDDGILEGTIFHWTPTEGDIGSHTVKLTISDGKETIPGEFVIVVVESTVQGEINNDYTYLVANSSYLYRKTFWRGFCRRWGYTYTVDIPVASRFVPGDFIANNVKVSDTLYLEGYKAHEAYWRRKRWFPRLMITTECTYPAFYAKNNAMNTVEAMDVKRSIMPDPESSFCLGIWDIVFGYNDSEVATGNYLVGESKIETSVENQMMFESLNNTIKSPKISVNTLFTNPEQAQLDVVKGLEFKASEFGVDDVDAIRYVIEDMYTDEGTTVIHLTVQKEIDNLRELFGYAEYLMGASTRNPLDKGGFEIFLRGNQRAGIIKYQDSDEQEISEFKFDGLLYFDGDLFIGKKFSDDNQSGSCNCYKHNQNRGNHYGWRNQNRNRCGGCTCNGPLNGNHNGIGNGNGNGNAYGHQNGHGYGNDDCGNDSDSESQSNDHRINQVVKLVSEKNVFIFEDILYETTMKNGESFYYENSDGLFALSEGQFKNNNQTRNIFRQNDNSFLTIMASESVFMGDIIDETTGDINISGSVSAIHGSLWVPWFSEFQSMNTFGCVAEMHALENLKYGEGLGADIWDHFMTRFDSFTCGEYLDTDFSRNFFYDVRFANVGDTIDKIILPRMKVAPEELNWWFLSF